MKAKPPSLNSQPSDDAPDLSDGNTGSDPSTFDRQDAPPLDAPDPFDPERLRLAQDFTQAAGVREALVRVPFEKPSKEVFFRVHPDAAFRRKGGIIELKDGQSETYWVDPSLWPALGDQPTFTTRAVFTAITRQGRLFLWGCRLPGSDGKTPDWISVPLEAAELATTQWVKMFWDPNQRRHRIIVAEALKDKPRWPDEPLSELLRLAFKDRVIMSLDHLVLRQLRGEV